MGDATARPGGVGGHEPVDPARPEAVEPPPAEPTSPAGDQTGKGRAGAAAGATAAGAETTRATHVGRRAVLGLVGLGAVGVVVGAKVQSEVGGVITKLSAPLGGLGALIPGADEFRIYTVTNTIPVIEPAAYRLHVTGMVDRELTLSLDDLRSMKRTKLVHYFQCVTGWRVPNVHWEGVKLGDMLDAAGVKPGATALRFFSGDGVYTESLTIEQARLPDVLVADKMIGNDVTPDHGGPVRLYVAPMYGYKSIKWLDRIEVTNVVVPGYWEGYGYPVNAWIGGQAET